MKCVSITWGLESLGDKMINLVAYRARTNMRCHQVFDVRYSKTNQAKGTTFSVTIEDIFNSSQLKISLIRTTYSGLFKIYVC